MVGLTTTACIEDLLAWPFMQKLTREAIDSSRIGAKAYNSLHTHNRSDQLTVCHAFDTKLRLAVPCQAILLVLQCSNCIIIMITT